MESVARTVARALRIPQRNAPPAAAAAADAGHQGQAPGDDPDAGPVSPAPHTREAFVAKLRQVQGGDPVLPNLVACGVGYHHAGATRCAAWYKPI